MIFLSKSSILFGDILIVIPCSKREDTGQPWAKSVVFYFGTEYSIKYLSKVLKTFKYSEHFIGNFICVTLNNLFEF